MHGQAGGKFAVEATQEENYNPRKRWHRIQQLISQVQDSRTLFNHGKNSSGYILQTIAQTKLQIQKKIYIYIYMLHWKTCFP